MAREAVNSLMFHHLSMGVWAALCAGDFFCVGVAGKTVWACVMAQPAQSRHLYKATLF